MMNLTIINNIIRNMAKNRQFYYSEADLQHTLAMALKSCGYDVYLEYPVKVQGKVCHIDIIALDKETGLYHPIELKYKTRAMTCAGLFGNHQLRGHSAQDINRYLFWKDVSRLESLKNCYEGKIGEGYVIFLTNDESYWQPPVSSKCIDRLFRIHPSNSVRAVDWVDKNGLHFDYNAGVVKYKCFSLNNKYTVSKWTDYSTDIDIDNFKSIDFKFLTITV